jgi:1-acyl-sn-glycerol-3-phosphate acyltransferase
MLDLAQLDRIRLHPRPTVQRVVANTFLKTQYRVRPGVTIDFQGFEKVPREPVIFAMNHTDFYTFFPFMYELIQRSDRYTSAWVKGKNYDTLFVAKFMEIMNQIPVPSRGYLISRDFVSTMARRPTEAEYTALRRFIDRGDLPDGVPAAILERPRDVLGRHFDPRRESYAEAMGDLLDEMMGRFLELNRRAFDVGLDLVVFPQGGRSVRLSRGRIGLAQAALHFERTIIPVAANYVDLIYPGGSILARGGHVVYRFMDPIPFEELRARGPQVPFQPFERTAEEKHRDTFQAIVDMVMDRIDEGLDERHRYTADRQSDGLADTSRFV